MEFLADDYPAETALKLTVVRAYNHRLATRNQRKAFAIERGLVDLKRQQLADRRRCKEDKAILGHLKVFQRFQSEEEFQALCEGVAVVRRLKKQIEAYKQYRQMGIRTLEQARAFEVDRKKREHQVKATRSKQGGGANMEDPAYHFSASQSELAASLAMDMGASGSAGDKDLRKAKSLVREAPNSSLLTEAEITLCAQTGMLPLHYLAVQEAVVRESFRNGTLTLDGFRRVVKVQRDEQLDQKMTRSAKPKRGDCSEGASSSCQVGLKRKAHFDVHQDGISADAAVKLFDFFVENVTFGGDGVGLPALQVDDSADTEALDTIDLSSTSTISSRITKRSRNTT